MSETEINETQYRDPFAPVPGAIREWVEVDSRNGATYGMAEFPDGSKTAQLLPLPANTDSIAKKSETSTKNIEIKMETVREVAKELVYGYVYALNPELADTYKDALSKIGTDSKNEELEDFYEKQRQTVSYLNKCHKQGTSAYDERDLISKAVYFASIPEEDKRKEEIEEYLYPLLHETYN